MSVAWMLLLLVLDMMQIHCFPMITNEDNILSHVSDPQIPSQVSVLSAISDSELAEYDKWQYVTEGETVLLQCTKDDGQHNKMWITPSFKVFTSANKSYDSEHFQKNGQPHIEILQSSHLLINDFGRNDAGRYRCFIFNHSGGIRRVINLGIDDAGFRKLYKHSLYIGATTAGLFLAIVLIMQALCYVINRYGYKCCCGTYISPKAKKVGRLIKTIEQYKTQQLDRLNQNYNAQVCNIKETCSRQMEHIQESYTSQMQVLKNLSQYSNQQLQQIRDQYNEQRSRVGEYSLRQMNKVHTNYMEQQDRVCRYTSRQLQHISETYKYQQKAFNKIMENIPDFNINSCLYMDPDTIEMKKATKCNNVINGRDGLLPTQIDILSKSLHNGMRSLDANNNAEIFTISSTTPRLPKISKTLLLKNESNIRKPVKNNFNVVSIPSECTVNSIPKSSGQQAKFTSLSSSKKMEDKYNVGDKYEKIENSVVQPHKIRFGYLL